MHACMRDPCTASLSRSPHPAPVLVLPAVASAGGAADLYPAAAAAAIDAWLATALGIERAAAAWCQPGSAAATAEQRAAARAQLEAVLVQLETALAGSSRLAGAATTLADVAVLSSLLPLYQDVLGLDAQQQFGSVTRWLQACAAEPQFAAVLGGCHACSAAAHTSCARAAAALQLAFFPVSAAAAAELLPLLLASAAIAGHCHLPRTVALLPLPLAQCLPQAGRTQLGATAHSRLL